VSNFLPGATLVVTDQHVTNVLIYGAPANHRGSGEPNWGT
jgi:hypothetical protein